MLRPVVAFGWRALAPYTLRIVPTLAHIHTDSGDPKPPFPLSIYYGSQSGTARAFALGLGKEGKKRGFKVNIVDEEDFDPDTFVQEKNVILVNSCYGKGEPTDNAKEFYAWLHAEHESNLLEGVNFAIFGLGSSKAYPTCYQAVSKALEKRMMDLGALPLCQRGEGDDSGTLEEDFTKWRKMAWPTIQQALGQSPPEEGQTTESYRPPFALHYISETDLPRHQSDSPSPLPKEFRDISYARILVNREMQAPESERSTIHVELDLSHSGLRYEAGDHVALYPENRPSLVSELGVRLGVDLDRYIVLKALDNNELTHAPLFPLPSTLRHVFTRHMDLNGYPSMEVLKVLSNYATDSSEADQLRFLGSNAPLHRGQIIDKFMNVVEVLKAFPSIHVPVEVLLDVIPTIKPRLYSISSSPKTHPTRLHITVAVVRNERDVSQDPFWGLTSHWLACKCPADPFGSVPIAIHSSKFRLPQDARVPVILIGAGTGLAPLRGFVLERQAMKRDGHAIGPMYLFFGCRNRKHDFLYEEELRTALDEGVLSELETAFSHEQDELIFIQRRIHERADLVWKLLNEQNAHVYVCGDARTMAKDVNRTLLDILQQRGGLSEATAEKYLESLERSGRYQRDVF